MTRDTRVVTWGVVVVLAGVACQREGGEANRSRPPATEDSRSIRTSLLQAGPGTPAADIVNPFEGNEREIGEGRRLYVWMNCHGCHGTKGGGGIGPPLADGAWIYGGAPANIHQAIVQGRPNGMPAYGDRLPDESIWRIAAFVRSLSEEAGGDRDPPRSPASPGEGEDPRARR